ncbi:hypothetical protein SERLA73DRAFT_192210 [Serpula lacrymans var. lacrymans S7.3]|uniref:G domain-containing protein n=2 Tax=Serpula lacrymans var. lacrymans TaxID=341189 RepID=F8QJB2_SERL3|nr:uncharacterized protein SERLADRAFT_471444 [Serpula lacrymans var. lacrymans S7.9]XP_007320166.1 uncharacterized protein SERLADRAFT_471455 [Serpula lacrymans var. lacrymans S7.9]EGN91607.1 hypothetical protein SERLA73DRAFT_192210 [Serpula lacrymans var. lacrymans S7.3]EGO22910.1 hypothetical protein SERLADRAFT_471444 [Serpula lacrymans var. lacrymans S7.9]EGO22926.1 hypothetical protein SERLADRAFT_471455 [Serpula lacrymans var. lacrymans S7.9]
MMSRISNLTNSYIRPSSSQKEERVVSQGEIARGGSSYERVTQERVPRKDAQVVPQRDALQGGAAHKDAAHGAPHRDAAQKGVIYRDPNQGVSHKDVTRGESTPGTSTHTTPNRAIHPDKPFSEGEHGSVTSPFPLQHSLQSSPAIANVLIFGESGTGKSSILNMIAGSDIAVTSNSALGCTFESVGYTVNINGSPYRLWDTAGLNEGEQGSVPAEQAIRNLQDLVQNMKEGVSLLVYCVSGGRFKTILKINYDLFYAIICQAKVPIVVVVTGLENEDPMESWWVENGAEFNRRQMEFAGHACVTITRGRAMRDGGYIFDKEFEESKIAMRELIQRCCSPTAWKVDGRLWLGEITNQLATYNEVREKGTAVSRTKESPNTTAVYGFLKTVLNVLGWLTAPTRAEESRQTR